MGKDKMNQDIEMARDADPILQSERRSLMDLGHGLKERVAEHTIGPGRSLQRV